MVTSYLVDRKCFYHRFAQLVRSANGRAKSNTESEKPNHNQILPTNQEQHRADQIVVPPIIIVHDVENISLHSLDGDVKIHSDRNEPDHSEAPNVRLQICK